MPPRCSDGEGINGANPAGKPSGTASTPTTWPRRTSPATSATSAPPSLVTIDTTVPAKPTLILLDADDSGLPLHPDVTNVQRPRVLGTAPFNSPVNFPVVILNVTGLTNATGIPVSLATFPGANGTYQVQDATPGTEFPNGFPDGTYTLVARTENLAGTFNYSAPLTVSDLAQRADGDPVAGGSAGYRRYRDQGGRRPLPTTARGSRGSPAPATP